MFGTRLARSRQVYKGNLVSFHFVHAETFSVLAEAQHIKAHYGALFRRFDDIEPVKLSIRVPMFGTESRRRSQ